MANDSGSEGTLPPSGPQDQLARYHEESLAKTPPYGKGTIGRLFDLTQGHQIETHLSKADVGALDEARQKLQIDALNLLDTIPSQGSDPLESEALELIRGKLASVAGHTTVSGSGDHLTLDPQDDKNLYNRLARSYAGMEEALIVLKLLQR